MKSVYVGGYADLYDLFYQDKPYEQEAVFIDRVLRRDSPGSIHRLLDVACGTGRHAASFADLGWEVVAVDLSEDMIRNAKGRSGGRSVEFVQQDMRTLELSRGDFDAAVCLFDSIGYAVTNDAIVATLKGIARHLCPGGLLAMEFWHAPPMLSAYEPYRVREWPMPDGVVVRVSRTSLNVVEQTATVDYAVHSFSQENGYASLHESHRNRFFQVQEMALLLHVAGFRAKEWFAGFRQEAAIDGATWHVVVLAVAEHGVPT